MEPKPTTFVIRRKSDGKFLARGLQFISHMKTQTLDATDERITEEARASDARSSMWSEEQSSAERWSEIHVLSFGRFFPGTEAVPCPTSVTEKMIDRFEHALSEHDRGNDSDITDPVILKAMRDGMESILEELKEERRM